MYLIDLNSITAVSVADINAYYYFIAIESAIFNSLLHECQEQLIVEKRGKTHEHR
jgi:hypothetical protein